MPNNFLKVIKVLILIIVLIFIFIYIKRNPQEFIKITDLTISQFLILSTITILNIALSALLFMLLLKSFGVNLQFMESFSLSVISRFANHLLIKGGPIARSIYLKKVHKLKIVNYLLITSFLSIMQLVSTSFLYVLLMIEKYFKGIYPDTKLLIFVGSVLIITIALLLLINSIWINTKIKKIAQLLKVWAEIENKHKIIIQAFVITLITIKLFSFKIFFIYASLFQPISFSTALIIGATGFLSQFIALTPASLGIQEALMSYIASLNGINFTTTFAVSSIDRIITIIWVFVLGLSFGLFYLMKSYKK
jgi:uncharacterized membrane protein YbhN (UPF0104 family)